LKKLSFFFFRARTIVVITVLANNTLLVLPFMSQQQHWNPFVSTSSIAAVAPFAFFVRPVARLLRERRNLSFCTFLDPQTPLLCPYRTSMKTTSSSSSSIMLSKRHVNRHTPRHHISSHSHLVNKKQGQLADGTRGGRGRQVGAAEVITVTPLPKKKQTPTLRIK
jgi:hypothetical protein